MLRLRIISNLKFDIYLKGYPQGLFLTKSSNQSLHKKHT